MIIALGSFTAHADVPDCTSSNEVQSGLGLFLRRFEERFMIAAYVHPKDPEIEKLAHQLIQGKASDLEKLEAIYHWITNNISYDLDYKLFAGIARPRSMDASEVLRRRHAICQGYSDLMVSLLLDAGIRVKIVMGRALDQNGNDLGEHAWNKALVDGRWVVFDATWDAVDHTNYYFDPNPAAFSLLHREELEMEVKKEDVDQRHEFREEAS